MALLMKPGREPAENWIALIQREFPDLECRVWPDVGDPADIEYIVANELPDGTFGTFPNLKFVAGTAVGVERLLQDGSLPADVPILRQVNPERVATMTAWALYHVIRHHRRFDGYRANQIQKKWAHLPYAPPEETGVGVMGLGTLGGAVARALRDLHYGVAGWARSRHDIDGIRCFAGRDELAPFLARTEILISILPNTHGTAGLLNRETLAQLPEGAYVINAGRGTLIDENALLAAMDSGHISGAALDVFAVEPLPQDHPFWTHPNITITPHYSCMGRATYGLEKVIEGIHRIRSGQPLKNTVDKAEGY